MRIKTLLILSLLTGGLLVSQTPSDPLAPTHDTKSAADIDREWQISLSKYDGKRAQVLREVDHQDGEGPYRADWGTLRKFEIPRWYKDAKFGIFIHWGVFSVPGSQNEWHPRNMYQQKDPAFKEHVQRFGPQDKFGYKDFIPQFKAEKWDPADWARLFKQAGARYVVPVAEHHDGFAMYNSDLSDWSAANMGPKRDVTGDLATAVRAEGPHFGTSFHRAEHDWFFDRGRTFRSDVNDPKYASLYGPAHAWLSDPKQVLMNDWTYLSPEYANDWLAHAAEIVQKYHPEVMYFDWWAGQPNYRHNMTRFAAFYYNLAAQQGFPGVIDIKDYALDWHAGARDFERGLCEDIEPQPWQTDTSISNISWGYVEHDDFKSTDFIVHQLIDIVSKNGNLLLDIGSWLKVNGEAINDTTPWKIYSEGPTKVQPGFGHDKDTKPYTSEDFRFTQKSAALYAIGMAWPADGHAVIHALGSAQQSKGMRISGVELVGSEAKLEFHETGDSLEVQLPAQAPGKYAYALKVLTADSAQ